LEEANNGRIHIYNAFAVTPSRWSRRITFFYIDTPDHKADNLIEKRGIRVKYLHDEVRDGDPYYVCACRIPKKQLEDFLEAMYELQKLMLICGHNDYEEFCNEARNIFLEGEEDE